MTGRRRRPGLVGLGLGLVVLAIVVFVTAAVLGYAAVERTVKGFARAPVGCTTTVEFHRAATFTLFLETRGRFASLDGDCEASGGAYSRRDDDPPRLEVSVVADGGGTLALDDPSRDGYDVEGFVGSAYADIRVATPGTYRITVTGEAADVAIAIGGDPDTDATWWWFGGFAGAAALAVLGVVLLIVGLVGRAASPPPASPTGFTVGTNLHGYTPVGSPPPAHMPSPPPGPGPWSTLPPPPPPPPAAPGPDATATGAALPPPPPPPN